MKKQVKYPYVLTEIFLYLVCSVFLLFPGFHGYYFIQDEKAIAFFLIFGGYLGLMGLFTLEMIIGGWVKPVSPIVLWKKASWAQRFAVFYAAFSLLSTILSPYQQWAWIGMSRYEGMISIGLYCGVFLCVSVFARTQKRMWNVFACSMIVFCGICMLQMMGYNPLWLYPDGLNYFDANKLYAGIYLGTIGNADLVASLLCLVIPAFSFRIVNDRREPDVLMITAAVLCTVVLIWMDVKAGVFGMAAGIWCSLPRLVPVSKRERRGLRAAVFGGILLSLAVIWLFPFDGMLYEANQLLHGNWNDQFGSGRVYIWKQVLQRVPSQLLFGSGPDTMMSAGIEGFGFTGETGQTFGTFVDTAHNEYLNVLFHQGIFAMLSYIGILITCVGKWLCQNKWERHMAGLGCGILCYCVQAMFGLSMCMTAGIFWVMLGVFENSLNKAAKGSSLCRSGNTY